MRQLNCPAAATVGEPINLQYEHVVSLSALPGVSGPLASHLFFSAKSHGCLPTCAHLQLKAADMISQFNKLGESKQKRGGTAFELPTISSVTDCAK